MTQLPLFERGRIRQSWLWLVSRLLRIANSRPHEDPLVFYAMKHRLLLRHALPAGTDLQLIVKECLRCEGSGYVYDGQKCRRCFGTGEYRRFWVYLIRWDFHGLIFHTPRERLYKDPGEPVTITGYIKHRSYGHASREALLWLALVYDRPLFRYTFTRGYTCLGWYWYPLENIRRAINTIRTLPRRWRARSRIMKCSACWRPCLVRPYEVIACAKHSEQVYKDIMVRRMREVPF